MPATGAIAASEPPQARRRALTLVGFPAKPKMPAISNFVVGQAQYAPMHTAQQVIRKPLRSSSVRQAGFRQSKRSGEYKKNMGRSERQPFTLVLASRFIMAASRRVDDDTPPLFPMTISTAPDLMPISY